MKNFKLPRERTQTFIAFIFILLETSRFVVAATVDARDMCMCKFHANFAYNASALRKKGIIGTNDPNILILFTVYDVNQNVENL